MVEDGSALEQEEQKDLGYRAYGLENNENENCEMKISILDRFQLWCGVFLFKEDFIRARAMVYFDRAAQEARLEGKPCADSWDDLSPEAKTEWITFARGELRRKILTGECE